MEKYNAKTDISSESLNLQKIISQRQNAYMNQLGNWQQQLDMIYHDFDGWKAAVKSIKSQYPKP